LVSSREGYIVMRQLKGGDLHTQWSTDPAIQVCIEYSRNLLRELSYLHAANIIHRDLKLENVLLENKDETTLKIADFGFSKMKSPKLDASVCGTDEYMAPEVLKNISNEKSDLFAVGMIILRLLSDRIKLTEADDFLAGKIKNYKVHKILYANGKGNGASKTSRLCAIPLDQQEALEKLVKKLIDSKSDFKTVKWLKTSPLIIICHFDFTFNTNKALRSTLLFNTCRLNQKHKWASATVHDRNFRGSHIHKSIVDAQTSKGGQ